jgi:hypothetical protein
MWFMSKASIVDFIKLWLLSLVFGLSFPLFSEAGPFDSDTVSDIQNVIRIIRSYPDEFAPNPTFGYEFTATNKQSIDYIHNTKEIGVGMRRTGNPVIEKALEVVVEALREEYPNFRYTLNRDFAKWHLLWNRWFIPRHSFETPDGYKISLGPDVGVVEVNSVEGRTVEQLESEMPFLKSVFQAFTKAGLAPGALGGGHVNWGIESAIGVNELRKLAHLREQDPKLYNQITSEHPDFKPVLDKINSETIDKLILLRAHNLVVEMYNASDIFSRIFRFWSPESPLIFWLPVHLEARLQSILNGVPTGTISDYAGIFDQIVRDIYFYHSVDESNKNLVQQKGRDAVNDPGYHRIHPWVGALSRKFQAIGYIAAQSTTRPEFRHGEIRPVAPQKTPEEFLWFARFLKNWFIRLSYKTDLLKLEPFVRVRSRPKIKVEERFLNLLTDINFPLSAALGYLKIPQEVKAELTSMATSVSSLTPQAENELRPRVTCKDVLN